MKNVIILLVLILMLSCSTYKNKDTENSFLIAYNVHIPAESDNDNYEIFTIEKDGSNPSRLTNHPDVAWTYLAVDDKILFISDRDTCYRCFYLYEMKSDGSKLRKITDFALADSWMGSRFDGRELIVRPAKDSVFYIIDRKGVILNRVSPGKTYVNDPCFSPNGKQIVFRGSDKAFKKDNGYLDELYIMNSDGSNLRQLTHYPENDSTAAWYSYHAGRPRWHPNENFISYQSKQNGKSSLFGVTPDGKKQWKLTGIEHNEGWHDWSADGKYLAIETYDLKQEQFHITLMEWNSKTYNTLTRTLYRLQQAPVFVRKTKK